MLFLADESCDHTIVRKLREQNYKVVSIAEDYSGITDREVLTKAKENESIVITEDKDFGRLIHIGGEENHPVILLRYSFEKRDALVEKLLKFLEKNPLYLNDSFIVIEPEQVRIRKYS